MAVTSVVDAPNMTREQYDAISKRIYFPPGKLPRGLVHHIASELDGGLRIVEIWDSETYFQAYFDDALLPVTREEGVELDAPKKYRIVRMRSRAIW
jgi:hypothetical protein